MTFVIAEAGVNHDGHMVKAYKLINEAKKAGADAVKFQLFNSHYLWGDDRITQYELSQTQIKQLKDYCDEVGIEFMCTPFDVEAVKFLTPLVKRHKIGSGCRCSPVMRDIIKTGLPVIVSTGMMNLTRKKRKWKWTQNATLLHCTSSYPCKPEDVNLNAMFELKWIFNRPVGLSDHTQGILASPVAVGMGAVVIEKHLTLDRGSEGPDHTSSIEPPQFKQMVENIREVEVMLGSGEKKILPCEKELRELWYAGKG
tara:strand:- start:77 stop:841 length:765 start_codon:yes stop_codon:yes gene_type:complete